MRRALLAACLLLLGAAPAPPPRTAGLVPVGHLLLRPCGDAGALCGALARPLDPRDPEGARIDIAFEYYRHRDHTAPPGGLIVGVEGGPGYSTLVARREYFVLHEPLMQRRDLLLADLRGTGQSHAIDCQPLQDMRGQTVAAVGACGRSLGADASLYGTALAADDLAALLDALEADRIDLYGDSYGSYFAQVFAARHPQRLRTLVLDGAYPVIGEDAFYGAAGRAVRRDLDLVCERAPTCRSLPGTSLGRIARLTQRLREHPITATTPDVDGAPMLVTLDPPAIGNVLYDGTSGSLNAREIDPAARALLDNDDPAPLLRLVAENVRSEGDGMPGGPAATYSRGLNAAVSCMDYPQLYDMTAPPDVRRMQADAAIAAKQAADPGVYAPVTIAEWQHLPLDISLLRMCEAWPLPQPPYPPGEPIPRGAAFPPVPTLVISGELDSLTTPEEGAVVARRFPAARHLVVVNSFHVDAVGDTDACAAPIVRHFIATGGDPGDIFCTARIKPLRLPPGFPRHASDTPPAAAHAGNEAPPADLAIAAAAVQTAGDALARWWLATGPTPGLRGGSFAAEFDGAVVTVALHGLRWAEDLPVSGDVSWDQTTGAVRASLILDGREGTLEARWNDRTPDARALIDGHIAGHKLAAAADAP